MRALIDFEVCRDRELDALGDVVDELLVQVGGVHFENFSIGL